MSRKVKPFTVTAEGRDKGKVFILTEKDSYSVEQWAIRAFLAIAKGGMEIPDDIASQGLAGLSQLDFSSIGRIPYDDLKPLLDEMMSCVAVQPDPTGNPAFIRALAADGSDIEDVKTRFQLRKEIWALHTDFFGQGAPSISGDPAAPAKTRRVSPITKMSRHG